MKKEIQRNIIKTDLMLFVQMFMGNDSSAHGCGNLWIVWGGGKKPPLLFFIPFFSQSFSKSMKRGGPTKKKIVFLTPFFFHKRTARLEKEKKFGGIFPRST